MSSFGGKFGTNPAEDGVNGKSDTGYGVAGNSEHNDGVIGESRGIDSAGVRGVYHDPNAVQLPSGHLSSDTKVSNLPPAVAGRVNPMAPRPGSAVLGVHYGAKGTQGHAVRGESDFGDGVWGSTSAADKTGVFGWSQAKERNTAKGVAGGNGVFGLSSVPNASGVYGHHDNGGVGVAGFSLTGIGVQGGGKTAGEFNGPVIINGEASLNGQTTVSGSLTIKSGSLTINVQDNSLPAVQVNGKLAITGEIDWVGPPQPAPADPKVQGLIHLDGGVPEILKNSVVGSPNWFQRVSAALLALDARLDWVEQSALSAAAAAGAPRTSGVVPTPGP